MNKKLRLRLLLLGGTFLIVLLMTVRRPGFPTGDPYSYVVQSRTLAGSSNKTKQLADLDHHLRSFRPASSKEILPGPEWNTHAIQQGGRDIHFAYSPAPGFPLLLAGAHALAPTAWTYLNPCLLLILSGFIIFLRQNHHRWILAGGLGFLAFLHLVAPQLYRLLHPWREISSLFFISLGSACVLLAGDRRSMSSGVALAGIAGLFLGFSVSIKESNLIPAAVGMLFFIRRHHLWPMAVACLGFTLGFAPLLLKNLATTGLPWVSLQTIRATPAVLSTEAFSPGLALGNFPMKLLSLLWLHHGRLLETAIIALLAGYGAWTFRRSRAGLLPLALLLSMLVPFLAWGGVDARHLFGVHAIMGWASGFGAVALFVQLRDKLPQPTSISPFAVALLAFAGFFFIHGQPRTKPVSPTQLFAFAQEVEANTPENSWVLCNRTARDVLGCYGQRSLIRLQELRLYYPLGTDRDFLKQLAAFPGGVYYLDVPDTDPRNLTVRDWREADHTLFTKGEITLHPIASLDTARFGLKNYLQEERSALYKVTIP